MNVSERCLRLAMLQVRNSWLTDSGVAEVFIDPNSDKAHEFYRRFEEIVASEEFQSLPPDDDQA